VDSVLNANGDPLPRALLLSLRQQFPKIHIAYARLNDVIDPANSTRQVQDKGGFITLGTIQQSTNQVQVQASIYYANVSGRGMMFFLEKQETRWRIRQSHVIFKA
jgi:hypothetical protein